MAFTPFGSKGPANTKATPFAPFGASPPTNPASDPSPFQNRSPSTGQPHQLFGVQSNPPINQTPPPLAFQNPSLSSGQSHRPTGIQRSPERVNEIQWGSGSTQRPIPSVRPYQFPGAQRPTFNPQFGHDGSRNFLKDHGKHSLVTSPASTSHILSRSGADTVEIGRSQDSKWKSRSDLSPDQSSRFSRRNQSLVSDIENDSLVDDILPPSTQTWMRSPSPAENDSMRSSSNPNQLTHQEKTPNNSFPYAHEAAEIQEFTKRNSSNSVTPDKPLRDDPVFSQRDSRRFSTSPPGPGTKTYMLSRSSDSQFRGQPSVNSFNNAGKTSISPATKRTKSPASYPVEEDIQGNYFSSQDYTEGEEQARAKRLARFKDELEPIESRPVDTTLTKSSVNKTTKRVDNKQPFNSLESSSEPLRGDALSDYENSEQPSLIIGLCPDMCPESERGERERKGDLDRYERVDGDRNQTSKSLAVKKYTRTAEREAILIRPMPILQITMEYLLSLLDRPYNENFLGMYNFLWDRMRAIRMDLRMQHIFNRESITLLEQMIRLHIIAMHELCEYTKGEGFTEGFDAHLNIEQMNKTSVELFQMYDDHRKKGITIPTEKEFRGYYALLKLDKHPGYKVEPSELSLDLASMTPEIRQTSEVLFARNVARACRTVNFIAFFRLARKSSYLQACLMHAHFSKLRTQALASLHAGLQNNQGLPVSDMSKWIGMEEEDIEALLEYHGFSIKMFEEPYMVKDDVFLHADKDYKTKCSKLVHMKKSRTIAEDVSAPSVDKDVSASYPLPSLSTEATKGYQPCITAHKEEVPPARNLKKQASISVDDEEMTSSKTSLLPEEDKTVKTSVINPVAPFVINSTMDQQKQNELKPAGGFYSPMKFYPPFDSPGISQAEPWKPNDGHIVFSSGEIKFPFTGGLMQTNLIPGPILQQSPTSMPLEIVPVTAIAESPTSVENKEESGSEAGAEAEAENVSNLEDDFSDIDQEDEDKNWVVTNQYDEEVANAKLKLIIRLWKRWSSRRSELRKRRQLAATAARNSISVGIPIGFSKSDHSKVCAMFDIDQAMRRRLEEHRKSWSSLNISDVISDIQVGKNPDSKCICWKVIVCSQSKSVNTATSACQAAHSAARQWLSSKLMPAAEHSLSDDNLILSAPGVSVWNKWVSNGPGSDVKCCLSVAKDVEADNDLCEATRGASAVLFLASVNLPLNLQREQLNCILETIPSGSVLPLLVVISSCNGESMEPDTDIILGLGLHDIDKSKIVSFTIVSIANKSQHGQELHFFDDSQLREGLKWLATNSPLQPNLYHVKPRDLVLTHFRFSLELLKQMPDQEVGPNTCISAFNNALETSQRNIISAAGTNHIGWPCPEIMLVEDNRKERLMVKHCLPNLEWSTAESIKSLNSALENCKLPYFEDDLTWLTVGCASGVELENHARRLEGCVVKYLTQTSNLMGVSFATKEAEVVIQRNARLELQNSSYYNIIPRWVAIFQRIINWQIMILPESSSSLAYVLKSDLSMSDSSYAADEFSSENEFQQSSAPLNLPLLDEMIQICCRTLKSPPYNHKAQRTVETERVINDHKDMEETMLEKSKEACTRIDVMVTVDDDRERSSSKREDVALAVAVEKKTVLKRTRDRFDELLEKCNLVQNSIAKKLCVYF